MATKRGTNIEDELANAERLLEGGAEEIWGWGTPAGRERVRGRVEFIVSQVAPGPGKTVLELGCGTGIFTRGVAEMGAHIVAVDVSERLIDRARNAIAAPNVEFIVGDLMNPGCLEGRLFDAFYCVSVLHHLDVDRALAAIVPHLKKGARFAISEPNLSNPLNRYYYFTDNLETRAKEGFSATEMAFTRDEMREIFDRHGFQVERLLHRDFLHPRTPVPLIPAVKLIGTIAERTPILRRLSGSLFCSGSYPG